MKIMNLVYGKETPTHHFSLRGLGGNPPNPPSRTSNHIRLVIVIRYAKFIMNCLSLDFSVMNLRNVYEELSDNVMLNCVFIEPGLKALIPDASNTRQYSA